MMKKYVYFFLFLLCAGCKPDAGVQLIDGNLFDTLLYDKQVSLVTLRNDQGMAAQITNYGARLVSLWVPGRDGAMKDVVWGYPSIGAYLSATDLYAGPIVGRYGNRLCDGKFSIGDDCYQVSVNNGKNHLHGGTNGFGMQVWEIVKANDTLAELHYFSADGEEGYPGNLSITVVYTLTKDNGLSISYAAETDKPTVVNPTSHVYFNLHGTTKESSNSHELMIHASSYTPTDSTLIPTGVVAEVAGTPMDFRRQTMVGLRMDADFQDLKYGKGYDHNFVLDKQLGEYAVAAELYEPATGIVMEVITDQPALQFYGGNFMDGVDTGKYGDKHNYRTGVALEAQNFPDAPNHKHFPSSLLNPGERYKQNTCYRFSVR